MAVVYGDTSAAPVSCQTMLYIHFTRFSQKISFLSQTSISIGNIDCEALRGTRDGHKCPSAKGHGQFAVFIGNLKIYGNQESVWCLNGETSVQASKVYWRIRWET